MASSAAVTSRAATRTRIALVGAMVAGVGTQYENVLAAAVASRRGGVLPVPVTPYRTDALERWGRLLPSSFRGTLRSVADTAPLFTTRDIDCVWTQVDLPLLPWLLARAGAGRVPVIYTADSTPKLLRSFGEHYGNWGGRSSAKARVRDHLHGLCLRRASVVNAWSRWAARSMRDDYGVAESRLVVLPPGVDTTFWRPEPRVVERRRLLFVGGDFRRKGGDLLLDVWRRSLRERAELHLVTRSGAVAPEPGVHVHTGLGPNDPRLAELYRTADVLVIPTRADCFSMAGLEGLASGVPLVTCPVGGVAEVFDDGVEGMYVGVDDGRGLVRALELLLNDRVRRAAMAVAARHLALTRYDAATNADRLLSLLPPPELAA